MISKKAETGLVKKSELIYRYDVEGVKVRVYRTEESVASKVVEGSVCREVKWDRNPYASS